MKKMHLSRESGSRSVCRYSARPSRQVKLLKLAEFEKCPVELRCLECEAKRLQNQFIDSADTEV